MKTKNCLISWIIFIFFLIFVAILLTTTSLLKKELTSEQKCNLYEGKWLAEQNECEWITQEQCEESKGTFDFCASPCRHTPSEVCATVCAPVCKY